MITDLPTEVQQIPSLASVSEEGKDEEPKDGNSQSKSDENEIPTAPSTDVALTPEHMMLKHPLQNKWAMWFFKNDKNKDWASNLRYITSFATVEDFWALYNHILPASKLGAGCDYSVFKDGVEPMWEDARNKKGGRWLINLNKQQRHSDLDNFWLETLLCLIGEAFDEQSDDICGAVVNIRPKGDKLAVWTADAKNPENNMKIGRTLKQRLNIPKTVTIGFQAHTDTISKSGSTTKNRFDL